MLKSLTFYILIIILEVVCFYFYEADGDLQNDIAMQLREGNSTSLSRRRRYLVFPEGSSFQLVFDLAYPSLDGIGFYVFGNTAGLAWELPSTPIFLDKKFHKKEEPEPTTTMLPHLDHPVEYENDWQPPLPWNDIHNTDYQDSSGWQDKAGFGPNRYSVYNGPKFGPIDRRPVSSYYSPFDSYKKKSFNSNYMSSKYAGRYTKADSNRGYSYKSNPSDFWNKRNFQNSRRKYGQIKPVNLESIKNRFETFDRDLHYNIHRRTRRELYTKLEELVSALIKDGKSCIMKTICLVNKSSKEKGTFFEELLKIIFKVKPDDFYEDEDDYDQAANVGHNCDEIYPECKGNIINSVIRTAMSK